MIDLSLMIRRRVLNRRGKKKSQGFEEMRRWRKTGKARKRYNYPLAARSYPPPLPFFWYRHRWYWDC